MITMEMLGKVRRMHVRDKLSVREIAKRTGLSRNTLQKWFRTAEEVSAPRSTFGQRVFASWGLLRQGPERALQSVTLVAINKTDARVKHCSFKSSREATLAVTAGSPISFERGELARVRRLRPSCH